MTSLLYDFSDASHCCSQHFIRFREGVLYKKVSVNVKELLIVDDQKAVHIILQFGDAVDGL